MHLLTIRTCLYRPGAKATYLSEPTISGHRLCIPEPYSVYGPVAIANGIQGLAVEAAVPSYWRYLGTTMRTARRGNSGSRESELHSRV